MSEVSGGSRRGCTERSTDPGAKFVSASRYLPEVEPSNSLKLDLRLSSSPQSPFTEGVPLSATPTGFRPIRSRGGPERTSSPCRAVYRVGTCRPVDRRVSVSVGVPPLSSRPRPEGARLQTSSGSRPSSTRPGPTPVRWSNPCTFLFRIETCPLDLLRTP